MVGQAPPYEDYKVKRKKEKRAEVKRQESEKTNRKY